MSCPHGVWHSEDCEMCQLEEKVSNAEAEALKYKLLFVASMMRVALFEEGPLAAPMADAATEVGLKYRPERMRLYGEDAPMRATLLKELKALGDSNG